MTHNECAERVTMYLRGMGQNGKPILAPDASGTFRIVGGLRSDGGRDILCEGFQGTFATAVAEAIHYERFYGHECGGGPFNDDLRSGQNGYVERTAAMT